MSSPQAAGNAGSSPQHTPNQGGEIVRVSPTATTPATRATAPGGALSLSTMTPHDAWRFAEALSGSALLPRQYQNNPASVLWALEYGRAIGLDVITTIQSVHVIQGRATASADLMASLTRRAGHRMRILGDDTRAEVVIIRSDDPDFQFRSVWDFEKAKRAKLTAKDTWQQYPGSMLRARAISECVRMACPEVLHGSIYTPEELGAVVDQDGMPVAGAVQQVQVVEHQVVQQMQSATRLEETPQPAVLADPATQGEPTQEQELAALGQKVQRGWGNADATAQNLAEAKAKELLDAEVPGPDGQMYKVRFLLETRLAELRGQSSPTVAAAEANPVPAQRERGAA